MALTFTAGNSGVQGNVRVWSGVITFDSSYPTGGEAIAVGDFGFTLEILNVVLGPTNVAGIDAVWDQANSKVILYDEDNTSGIAAQVADTTDMSATTVPVTVTGR